MANIPTIEKSNGGNVMSRRDFLRIPPAFALLAMPKIFETNQGPESDLTPGIMSETVPFLPATEAESADHVRTVNPESPNWGLYVTPRVFLTYDMNNEQDPDNPYGGWAKAVNAYARIKEWINDGQSYLAYEQVYAYPSYPGGVNQEMLTSGEGETVRANGKQIEIDAIQVKNFSVAVAPIFQKHTLVYVVPGVSGQIFTRIVRGEIAGETALAFAPSRHEDLYSREDEPHQAVHIKGRGGMPVRVTYQIPKPEITTTNNHTAFDTYVINTTLSSSGHLAVHLPNSLEYYQGNYSPTVTIHVKCENDPDNPQGEDETIFMIGSDNDSAGKNRVTLDDLEQRIRA